MNAVVRTFRGSDPRTALDAVRSALGEEAIISRRARWAASLDGKRSRSPPPTRVTTRPSYGARPLDLESEVSALRRIVEQLRAEVRSSKAEPRGPAGRTGDALTPAAAAVMRRLVNGAVAGYRRRIVRAACGQPPVTANVRSWKHSAMGCAVAWPRPAAVAGRRPAGYRARGSAPAWARHHHREDRGARAAGNQAQSGPGDRRQLSHRSRRAD